MIRAIVVDDEPAVASIIRHFIEREGLPVRIEGLAENGREALQLIRTLRPDLVFLDIQMPLLNGLEVMHAEPSARYVVITAYESFQYAQEALRLGARDLLVKPVDGAQLVQAIARAVGWQCTQNHLTNQVLAHIHRHYAEPFDLLSLARDLHVTPSHLARTFKKHTGYAVLHYLHKVRTDRARTLLQDQSLSVQDVAIRAGYESLNVFYKHFKSFTGIPPALYRKNADRSQDASSQG